MVVGQNDAMESLFTIAVALSWLIYVSRYVCEHVLMPTILQVRVIFVVPIAFDCIAVI